MPILYNDKALAVIYIFFNTVILLELASMDVLGKNKKLLKYLMILVSFTFFMFIILKITETILVRTILEIIITIWIFDTLSFLGGKIIGGKKLIPSISPGKTLSGFLVGFFATIILSQIYNLNNANSSLSILFIIFIIVFSFLGDLAASKLKRVFLIKDSGSILPGHGGLLDRLDSFIGVFIIIGIMSPFI